MINVILITISREIRDVVFEDVVFDNDSSVTPIRVKSMYRIR